VRMFRLEAGELPSGERLYLRGTIYAEEGQRQQPVVVLCHGFKGFAKWGFFPYAAQRLAEEGYYVVLFDFSCNGVGEVDFDELDKFACNTYSREQADIELVVQAVKQRELPLADQVNPEQLYLLGHSRGGGNSIIYAAQHPEVKAVVTWNGIARADLFDTSFKEEVLREGVGYVANARTKQSMPIRSSFYEDLQQNEASFDIAAKLASLPIPVLQLQGDQDSPRLQEGFRLLREAAPQQPAVTIAGGNHTFGAVHPFKGTTPQIEEALEETIRFLAKVK
jgi:uncharacterized protein